MFSLATLKDSVKIHPKRIHAGLRQCVIDELNFRYCNRVISEVGLAVRVFDVLEMDDPYVYPGEPFAFVKVKFRLVVMRPFVGEVIVGKIRSCAEDGIHVSLHFFDDIFIPATCLQTNSRFDAQERLWIWSYDGNDLYMDLEEPIRFRVLSEAFTEVAPLQKEALLAAAMNKQAGEGAGPEVSVADVVVPTVAPYKVIASIAEDGLGLLSWWANA